MIRAVLFDLDDTLLRLSTDAFSRKYIAALGGALMTAHPTIRPEAFQGAVRSSIKTTAANTDPTRTNGENMNAAFASALALSEAEIASAFHGFYESQYAGLRAEADPMPGARELVATLADEGYTVVVATNPVFPRGPVMERLRWAGFDTEALPFAWVTTMDNMHFIKPTPHYYEEILARVGVEAEDALLVGDDLNNDILPGTAAGLATYWINEDMPPEGYHPNAHGSMTALADRVRNGWLRELAPRPRTTAQVAPRMLGNLAALDGLARELQPAMWMLRPFPEEWTALELVQHLLEWETRVQRAQILRALQEDNPFLPPAPTPPGPNTRDLSARLGPQVLAEFFAARRETLALLATLTPEQWARPARHALFGPVTVMELAHFTARHDRLHINQFCELVGACRERAVR